MTIEIEDLKKVKIEPDEFLLVKFSDDNGLEQMHNFFRFIKETLGHDRVIGYHKDMAEFKVVKFL